MLQMKKEETKPYAEEMITTITFLIISSQYTFKFFMTAGFSSTEHHIQKQPKILQGVFILCRQEQYQQKFTWVIEIF